MATAGAIACGGSKQPAVTPLPTHVTVLTQTPIVFPSAAAGQDEAVWDFVRSWQGANFVPLLRPTFVPAGFDTVTIDEPREKQDPHVLSVVYAGPGKELHISAGGINPSEAYQDGSQRDATVRGQPAIVEVNNGGDARNGVVVWWREPGSWAPGAGQTPSLYVDYAVLATGLTEEEVLQVADSMEAMAP